MCIGGRKIRQITKADESFKKLSYEGKEPDRVVAIGRGNGRGSLFNGADVIMFIF